MEGCQFDLNSTVNLDLNTGTGSIQCSVSRSILPLNNTILFTVDPNQVAGSSFVTYNLRGLQDNVTQLNSYSGHNVNNPFGMAWFMQWTGVANAQIRGSDLQSYNKYLSSWVGAISQSTMPSSHTQTEHIASLIAY
jgi:hypothetical protein